MNYMHDWKCQSCGEAQRTVDWPEHQFCIRHDLFTLLPCVVCGLRTSVTPAELYQAKRLKAVHADCVLIEKESGEEVADVQSLRSRDDRPAGQGLGGTSSSRAERGSDDGAEPVESAGLGDDPSDGNSSTGGLERGESGHALEDLHGAEVTLVDRGQKLSIQQRATIIDGDGKGTVGEVVEIRSSQFGHIHVTLQADDGTRATTLESKVAPV